jgi:pimeloyl-ACP methyl ester carboxylesterase
VRDEPTLLCVPGLACDLESWTDAIQDLADVARCHVADITQADSIAAMADTVLADAPPRFALAGHSLGGYVSFEILRRAPDRVTRLALIGTSARPDLPNIAVPTLVAAGDEDALMPAEVQAEMAHGIAVARRDTIERCGHTAPLEAPEHLAALLRGWLLDQND